ncbi:MAG: helix-turn-helix transcriptional regulator [Bacteroidales bacterium]|nr:helix-turn-helix transcriptional regulator [Bacteroidales bacterium]
MRLKKTGQTLGKTFNILQGEVNRNYIGMLERGERNPTCYTLLAVANGLEVELYELIKG